MFKSFKTIKWYEWSFLVCIFALITTLSVVYKSSALVILNAIVSTVAVFFISKGIIIGNFLGIGQVVLYSIISYNNALYGELIITLTFSLFSYLFSIVSWFKDLTKENVIYVNKKIGWKEYLILFLTAAVLMIGVYFLLKHFNTANLIVSVLSCYLGAVAGYLAFRRCEYNFIFYIINNIVCIVLWSSVTIQDISNLPVLISFAVFLILNSLGVLNWTKLKKEQKTGEKSI